VLFKIIENMGDRNAVVISQKTLAKMLGISDRTVKTAVSDLTSERWIQSVKLGPGTVNAYVINSRVAWAQKRDELRLSLFHAAVVADHDDQDPVTLDDTPLRIVPVLYPGERQLPTDPGLPPPSQPFLDSLEPNLPGSGKEE
jgi:DNA-binding transcriptional MocR family regulator